MMNCWLSHVNRARLAQSNFLLENRFPIKDDEDSHLLVNNIIELII